MWRRENYILQKKIPNLTVSNNSLSISIRRRFCSIHFVFEWTFYFIMFPYLDKTTGISFDFFFRLLKCVSPNVYSLVLHCTIQIYLHADKTWNWQQFLENKIKFLTFSIQFTPNSENKIQAYAVSSFIRNWTESTNVVSIEHRMTNTNNLLRAFPTKRSGKDNFEDHKSPIHREFSLGSMLFRCLLNLPV